MSLFFLTLSCSPKHEESHCTEHSRYNSINLHVSSALQLRIAVLESISIARYYIKCPKHDSTNAHLHSESSVHTALRRVSSSLNLQRNRNLLIFTEWRRNSGVSENTNTCQGQRAELQKSHKWCRMVADLSQNTEFVLFLFCQFSVNPAKGQTSIISLCINNRLVSLLGTVCVFYDVRTE
jgi:hypothetical protein